MRAEVEKKLEREIAESGAGTERKAGTGRITGTEEKIAEDEIRFRKYRKLLERRPDYRTAVIRTEKERKLTLEEKLYLYVFAPVITEYVVWVLEEACRSGKKRLYFLSRDGFSMYMTAVRLAELGRIPVECRYLHVSRYACRIPSYHLDMEKCLEKICTCGIDVTLEKILKRGALTEEETKEVIEQIGWKGRSREILNRVQILELKELLGKRTRILDYIERHSRDAYGNTMGYLEQEGLLSEIPYALVDSGWVGTLQQSIQTLVLSRRPDICVQGYYFGLYEIPRGTNPEDYHGWYFTPDRHLKRKACFSNSLLEAVCSAGEGMTKGYLPQGDRYVPGLCRKGNPNRERIEKNQEVLERFLQHLQAVWREYDQKSARREDCWSSGWRGNAENSRGEKTPGRKLSSGLKLAESLLSTAMSCPTQIELEAWGDFLFSDDVLEERYKKVAAELSEREIREQRFWSKLCVMTGLKKTVIRESAWIEGSIVRCGAQRGKRQKDRWFVRKSISHARWYKYFVYGRKQLLNMRNGRKTKQIKTGKQKEAGNQNEPKQRRT